MVFASSASGSAVLFGAALGQAATLTATSVLHFTPSPFEVSPDCKANVQILPARSSDPGRLLCRLASSNKGSGAVVLLGSSDPVFISRLIPYLPELASLSAVLHIATSADHTPVTSSLRFPGITQIYSGNATEAQINALVATKVARQTGRAVIHFFEADDKADQVKLYNKTQVTAAKKFIDANAKVSNGVNGHSNGDVEMNGAEEEADSAESVEAVIAASYKALPRNVGSGEASQYFGSATPSKLAIAVGSSASVEALSSALLTDSALLYLSVVTPLSSTRLLSLVPESAKSIVVLEQAYSRSTKLGGPIFLDILQSFNESDRQDLPNIASRTFGKIATVNTKAAIASFHEALSGTSSSAEEQVVGAIVPTPAYSTDLHVPKHESAYTRILETTFGPRFDLVNKADPQLDAQSDSTIPSTLPDYALGKVLANKNGRDELLSLVRSSLSDPSFNASPELKKLLSEWLSNPTSPSAADKIVPLLTDDSALARIKALSSNFNRKSSWIIGSDAWSYDLGTSGVHHALSSGADVNLLIIDSQPYDGPEAVMDAERRAKKDVGLYAMNYGNAYVASVAVYGDYSQVVRAFVEADKFDGPAVIVAYLPNGDKEETKALDVLKETKKAIDSGFWPLYRWNPTKDVHRVPGENDQPAVGGRSWNSTDENEAFQLDSERIKADLRAFLDRQNHLTQVALNEPKLADSIVGSLGKKIADAVKVRAQSAFEKLSGAIDGPSLLVLYASDGGNAEKVAKKFSARARARGLGSRAVVMDEFSFDDLALEPNVVLITSTAGQGEFPTNGRLFWKALQSHNNALGPDGGEGKSLDQVKYTVFGMGDSHYWPRPEDAHYYNKSSKDLDKKFEYLGAVRFADLGLGDDQDADGYQTGYKIWEQAVWKSFGVDQVEVVEAEPEPVTNEHIKIASNYLRGTIKEGLKDTSTGALAESDGQLTKFHGIYQQDDRDIREQRKAEGLEPAYSFMVRVRMPAGVCQANQWLAIDEISDRRGNHTFKLTTRQTFQFHGIIKSDLKPAIQEINKATLDTVAACGDVNRNVMCSSNPSLGVLHKSVHEFAVNLSEHLMPMTTAYSEIWLDKVKVAGEALKPFAEPLYGQYYLPRKFKIAIAVPPQNDVDVFCNDVGFIAIVDPATKQLQGFNVSIGGGMGVTHAMKTTYPRLGSVIGFCTPEQGCDVAEKIMTVQRDHGNRANRKNARLKYTIDRMGLENYVAEVEKRLGYRLQPARAFEFTSNIDEFGWKTGEDGRHHCTVFIENGRVEDAPGKPFKTGMKEIAKLGKCVFRLTGNQHVTIADVADEDLAKIKGLMAEYKLDNFNHSGLRLSSSACVAFPTCGLAMAESERFLPGLIDRLEKIMEEVGLRHDSIVARVTGCPNGCARPYAAEVGFVGKAPNSYLMLLGGGYHGNRLNKIYKEAVSEEEIVEILTPMFKSYAKNRLEGEPFGDFSIRQGWVKATDEGKNWYVDQGEHKPVEI